MMVFFILYLDVEDLNLLHNIWKVSVFNGNNYHFGNKWINIITNWTSNYNKIIYCDDDYFS